MSRKARARAPTRYVDASRPPVLTRPHSWASATLGVLSGSVDASYARGRPASVTIVLIDNYDSFTFNLFHSWAGWGAERSSFSVPSTGSNTLV